MSVILNQLANFANMDLDNIKIAAIKKSEKDILEIHRDQLRMGLGGKGDIKPKYRKAYLNYKQSLPSYFAGNKVDLYLTGDFQNSTKLYYAGNEVEITATDKKTYDLVDKYTDDIFELNKTSKEIVHDSTTPKYYKLVHEQLNK